MSTICWVLIQCFPVFSVFPSCSGCIPKTFWHFFFIQIISGPARNLVKSFGIVSHFARFLHLEFDFQVMRYVTLFFFSCLRIWEQTISPLEQVMLSQTYVSKWSLRQISVSLRILLKNFGIFCTQTSFFARSWFYVWF